MQHFITMLGVIAAALTSLSYLPQVRKSLPRKSTHDISFKTTCSLTLGLLLWVIYGVLHLDWVIVGANAVGALLSGAVMALKVRDMDERQKE